MLRGREDQAVERVFSRIPSHLDIHQYRRLSAQSLSRSHPESDLPLLREGKRIKKEAYDLVAVGQVSHALGHHRLDVVLTHYLN